MIARLFHPSRLRRRLASPALLPSRPGVFLAQARRFTVAQVLTHSFYAFLLYFAVTQSSDLPSLLDRTATAPLWPVRWISPAHAAAGSRILLTFYLATNIFGAFTVRWRASRVLTFLGLLELVAFKNSFGKIGHSLHLPLLVAGVFVLLPAGWERPAPQTDRRLRQETLLVFWLAQAAVLLSYTMSGVGKFAVALYQLCAGQPNALAPGGLSALVAQRLIETRSTSYFGAWIIHHPLLTWPAQPIAIYLELFAFAAAFRPALARPWALALIVLHVGIYFTMTIRFPQNCFLLAILLLSSPFEPVNTPTWQTRLLAVPLLPDPYKLWRTTRRMRGEYSR